MKIAINYDLLQKIKEANIGMRLEKNFKLAFKNCSIGYLIGSSPAIIHGNYFNVIADSIPSIFFSVVIVSNIYNILEKKVLGTDNIKREANITLGHLVTELNQFLYLNTEIELLKQSQIITTNYKIRLNNNKLPVITQNKHILVPTYDTLGNIKETSLLQEHNIGSGTYELSIGSPKKELKYKFSYDVGK